jgi:hypothetical protein
VLVAAPCVRASVETPVVVFVLIDKEGGGTFTVYCRVFVLPDTDAILAVEPVAGNIVGGIIFILVLYAVVV